MANALTTLSVTSTDEGYQLRLEDDQGGVFEVTATFDQLDLLSEEIDRNLDRDEEGELSVDEAEQ
jgi:hypothetical protein